MMDNMMRDVTIYGTAARASVSLKRQDLAGKTGTTNEYMDAWFCGYQMTVVGCAWLGFDQPKTLGNKETGGAAALPIWIGYMNRALRDVPVEIPSAPEGLITSGDGRGGTSFILKMQSRQPQWPETKKDQALLNVKLLIVHHPSRT
jgi:penicillin-binding protein 1A